MPYELIVSGDPMYLSTYIAALRYATVYNEVNGSLRLYMTFLGYSERSYTKAADTLAQMRKSLGRLCEEGYIAGNAAKLKTLPPNESFKFPFGPHSGWRRVATSQDAKFGVKEIQQAIYLAKNVRWDIPGNLAQVLYLASFLRMQRDLNAYAPGKARKERRNICVLELDDVAATLQMTDKELITRLKYLRAVHLGSYRIVAFQTPEGERNKRFLFFSDHGREGTSTITEAVKRMKEVYQDLPVIYDNKDPRLKAYTEVIL